MKIPEPRDYQAHGIELTRQAMREGFNRILFWLATGGGKSVIFLKFLSGLILNSKRVLFLVKRKQLVFQTARHLKKSGIDCSILIANHAGFDPKKPLQIASIDTIIRRDPEFLKQFDFVIVDEAHDATSPSYQNFFKVLIGFGIKNFIGLTATPFPMGKKVHDFWQCVVKPIEMHELRDRGYLVPVDLYHPDGVNFEDIKVDKKTGDFNSKSLSAKMRDLKVTGDTIDLYKRHGRGLPALCFCVDKDHSMTQAEAFNRAGIEAVHADESTPQVERDEAIERLKKARREKRPFVLCNVNIFSTGVDIPEAQVGLMNRATLSETLYIQQVGRLLRPYKLCVKCKSQNDCNDKCYTCGYHVFEDIKEDAVIIDQGDNTSRFGEPYEVRYACIKQEDLELRAKGIASRPLYKTCTACYKSYPAATKGACPRCGEITTRERFHTTVDGELVPYNEYETMKNYHAKLVHEQQVNFFKASWSAVKMYEKFGDKVMKFKRDFDIPSWVPESVKTKKEEKLSGKVYR